MIDLRNKSLPSTVKVGGRDFPIYTDFRKWLQFGTMIVEKHSVIDYAFLFRCPIEDLYYTGNSAEDVFHALYQFYSNPNDTPRLSNSAENVLDFIQDGEYIVGSFMQAYNIDLTECDMHWHKFNALFRSLPSDTKIVEIMGARGYKKDSRKQETRLEERRNMWKRPTLTQQAEEQICKGLQELFYNS